LGETLGDDYAAAGNADNGKSGQFGVSLNNFVSDPVKRAVDGGCIQKQAANR
jgi:hypothetical protein